MNLKINHFTVVH